MNKEEKGFTIEEIVKDIPNFPKHIVRMYSQDMANPNKKVKVWVNLKNISSIDTHVYIGTNNEYIFYADNFYLYDTNKEKLGDQMVKIFGLWINC